MPHGVRLLDQVDLALMLAGAAVLAVTTVYWLRRGPRDPLRGSPIRANSLSPMLIWLVFAALFVGITAGSYVARPIVPDRLGDHARETFESVVMMGVGQLSVSVVAVAVGALVFTGGLRGFGLGRRSAGAVIAWSAGGFVVSIYVTGLIVWYTSWAMELLWPGYQPPEHTVFQVLSADGVPLWLRILTLASAAVLAPVAEELFFRGILQTAGRRLCRPRHGSLRHRWAGIAFAAVAFGLMHSGTPQFIPALLGFGVILGYLYERTGSLTVAIVVHVLFNAKSLLFYHLLWLLPSA